MRNFRVLHEVFNVESAGNFGKTQVHGCHYRSRNIHDCIHQMAQLTGQNQVHGLLMSDRKHHSILFIWFLFNNWTITANFIDYWWIYWHTMGWTMRATVDLGFAKGFQTSWSTSCCTLQFCTLLYQTLLQCSAVIKKPIFRPSMLFSDLVLWPGFVFWAHFDV